MATSYTIKDIPEGMWKYFKASVQGNLKYTSMSERIIDLVAADMAAKQNGEEGIVELAIESDLVTDEQLDEAKDLEVPE